MAYALGYAGGYGDVVTEPQLPPPVIVGGGAPLYSRRWTTRPAPLQPLPPPVRIQVRISVTYQWAAKLASISMPIKMATLGLRLGQRAKLLTIHIAEQKVNACIETKNLSLAIGDPIAQNRKAWDRQDENDLLVALAALT